MLSCVVAFGHPPDAFAQESPAAESLSELLSEAPTGGISPIGRVEKIALGSRGATVTLEGGEEILLDFSGLAGGEGGPNYVGWGMLLFGLSVATRLLATVTRLTRPFAAARRRRRRYEDD